MRRLPPAGLSILNASMGVLAVYSALRLYPLSLTYTLILMGIVFDGLDGIVARRLRVAGRGGALLDSLCDIVTFSLAPSALIYVRLYRTGSVSFHSLHNALVVTATYFLFIFSLYRLIRYYREYVEGEPGGDFSGLPAPACAFFVTSLLLVTDLTGEFPQAETLYLATVVLVTPLMATRIRYPRPSLAGGLIFLSATAAYILSPPSLRLYPSCILLLLSILYILSPVIAQVRGRLHLKGQNPQRAM